MQKSPTVRKSKNQRGWGRDCLAEAPTSESEHSLVSEISTGGAIIQVAKQRRNSCTQPRGCCQQDAIHNVEVIPHKERSKQALYQNCRTRGAQRGLRSRFVSKWVRPKAISCSNACNMDLAFGLVRNIGIFRGLVEGSFRKLAEIFVTIPCLDRRIHQRQIGQEI